MSQASVVIPDTPGLQLQANLNGAFAALVTGNSGPTAPLTTYPYMIWEDTATGVRKKRNSSNTGWVDRKSVV